MEATQMLLLSKADLKELFIEWNKEMISLAKPNHSSREVDEEVFNLQQAATYLNLKPNTIYMLKSENKIPFLKRGRKLCFSKKDLDEWNANGRPENPSTLEQDVDKILSADPKKRKPAANTTERRKGRW